VSESRSRNTELMKFVAAADTVSKVGTSKTHCVEKTMRTCKKPCPGGLCNWHLRLQNVQTNHSVPAQRHGKRETTLWELKQALIEISSSTARDSQQTGC
jgi:hypothetical protein